MTAPATVTIWLAAPGAVRRCIGLNALDPAERHRAGGISHPGELDRYLASRALLRHAMGEASRGTVAPDRWRFVTGSCGKPAVSEGLPSIPFSLSHAADCIAVAVGGSAPLGIDAEGLWRGPGSEVVQFVLTDTERCGLSALDEEARWTRFVRIWTVKEACAKALGEGAAADFASVEVALDPLSATLARSGDVGLELFGHEARIAGRCYHVAAAALRTGEMPTFRLISLED